jgi:hypothetical protein
LASPRSPDFIVPRIASLATGGVNLPQLCQFAGMTPGEGGGFLGGFGEAG